MNRRPTRAYWPRPSQGSRAFPTCAHMCARAVVSTRARASRRSARRPTPGHHGHEHVVVASVVVCVAVLVVVGVVLVAGSLWSSAGSKPSWLSRSAAAAWTSSCGSCGAERVSRVALRRVHEPGVATVGVVAATTGLATEGRDAGLLDASREGGQGVGRGRPAGRRIVPKGEI